MVFTFTHKNSESSRQLQKKFKTSFIFITFVTQTLFYMNNYWRFKDDVTRLYNAPEYRRLKYAAIIVIGLVILAQIAMIIWRDDISERTRLFIQGSSGLGAIVFVILIAVWSYKVFSEYFGARH